MLRRGATVHCADDTSELLWDFSSNAARNCPRKEQALESWSEDRFATRSDPPNFMQKPKKFALLALPGSNKGKVVTGQIGDVLILDQD